MSNSSQYKAMMDEVHASADLIGKVKGIPMEKTKKRTTALKFATATCAALLGVFVVTNGVCYAATGETWVEKATVYINGEPVEMDVQMSQNGDTTVGEINYTAEDADGEGGEVQMTMISEGGDFDDTTYEIHDYTVEGADGEGGEVQMTAMSFWPPRASSPSTSPMSLPPTAPPRAPTRRTVPPTCTR